MKEFDKIELLESINPVIKKGMHGYILEVYDNGNVFEVEFPKEDATDYEYDGQYTFAISKDKLKSLE